MIHQRSVTYIATSLAIAVFIGTLGGCPGFVFPPPGTQDDPLNGSPGTPAKLIAFDSPEALLDYFKTEGLRRIEPDPNPVGFFDLFGIAAPTAASPGGTLDDVASFDQAAPEDSRGGDGGENADDYSTTNLQVAGVDEADIFKSDGTNFYFASGNLIRILQATPLADMAELSTIEVGHQINEMYFYQNFLIVMAVRYEEYQGDGVASPGMPEPAMDVGYGGSYYYGGVPRYIIAQIDISDPANPALVHELEVDGLIQNSRLTDGRLVVITSVSPNMPYDGPAIQALELDDLMPNVRTAAGAVPMVHWSGWYHPAEHDGYQTTAVVTIDAGNVESIIGALAIVADAGVVYMTTDALYVTDDDYSDDYGYRPITAIHKITFDEAGVPQYAASGSVPGRVLNQFSLDEYEDHLRLATHVEDFSFFFEPWFPDVILFSDVAVSVGNASLREQANEPSEPYNAVWVLGQDGGALEITGSVENIAPGEDIYAARFLGDHGFLVTFERMDPLFVLNLTDPADPQLLGELEIPGFSEYLHPYGENHLIGVGRSTEISEWGGTIETGVQLSLFDVSDWANPTAVQQITIGEQGSFSDVSNTHKAFTFREADGLLALPAVVTIQRGMEWGYPVYGYEESVLLFQVSTETGFTQLGRLDVAYEDDAPQDDWWYQNSWRRAAFIGDTLYAVAPSGVRGAPLDDLSADSSVGFPLVTTDYYYGYMDTVDDDVDREIDE